MASMMEELAGALGGENLGALAGMFGTDKDMMGKAVAAALPALVGGLARNTREPQGAEALFGALNKSHSSGSILDAVGMIFGGNQWAAEQSSSMGEKILGHVFGGGQNRVEQQVAQSSGMQAALVKKLLPMLAPIVLGYLGKKMAGGGDAGGLAASLQNERQVVQKDDGILGGLLDLLDGDDDGDNNGGGGGLLDTAGDLLSGPAGRAILGKLLGG